MSLFGTSQTFSDGTANHVFTPEWERQTKDGYTEIGICERSTTLPSILWNRAVIRFKPAGQADTSAGTVMLDSFEMPFGLLATTTTPAQKTHSFRVKDGKIFSSNRNIESELVACYTLYRNMQASATLVDAVCKRDVPRI